MEVQIHATDVLPLPSIPYTFPKILQSNYRNLDNPKSLAQFYDKFLAPHHVPTGKNHDIHVLLNLLLQENLSPNTEDKGTNDL